MTLDARPPVLVTALISNPTHNTICMISPNLVVSLTLSSLHSVSHKQLTWQLEWDLNHAPLAQSWLPAFSPSKKPIKVCYQTY